MIVGIFVAYAIASWAWQAYVRHRGEQAVNEFAHTIESAERDAYKLAMADTYGGKTPQETLRMYIDAVQKRDYELASKYFIGDKQAGELKSLSGAPRKNIEDILELLNEAIVSEGGYSANKDGFVIRKPILIDFKLYPNGVWKIIEI